MARQKIEEILEKKVTQLREVEKEKKEELCCARQEIKSFQTNQLIT